MLNVHIDCSHETFVASTARYLGDCAAALGLPVAQRAQLEQAVEHCCLSVLHHAYEPGEEVRYQVSLQEEPGALVVGIRDRGLPFNEAQLSSRLRDLVDEIRLVSLGREGKRLELVLDLEGLDYESHLTESDRLPDQQSLAVSDGPVTIRMAEEEDAIAIARCVYRCYGRSYRSEYLYKAKKLRSLWQAGQVTSVVAAAEDGEVVGHLCYWVDNPTDLAGESTDAIVDPRYRGRHLFDQMKSFLVKVIREQGRLGMISEAVTVHPYSQKGVLATGAVETGLMLGDLPSDLSFKGIEGSLPSRQSCMLCYLRLNQEPHRSIYLPARHAPILEKIYRNVKLDRTIEALPAEVELPEQGRLEVHLDEGWAEAALRVVTYGQDLETLFRSHLRHLLANNIPYLYAELPLGDPAVAGLVPVLEGMGFSFAGLVPELSQGDILRLHYLANIEIDMKIVAVTDWGREIREYVLAQAGLSTANVK